VDLDQLAFEPNAPSLPMLKRTAPGDPNEFLLGDDEIGDIDFDEILADEVGNDE